ncbi:MAG: hypothetical protein KAV00_15845 [Phycisphaerae bacterium]|nr:hypothetical protein [Phycisphaerae bacterium]
MAKMSSRERLLAAIEGRPVDMIPVSPRIWRYAMWKGLSKLELAVKFDFDLFIFGEGGLLTPLGDTYCEMVKTLLPDAEINITTRREGEKTVLSRAFRTPAGTLRDSIVQPDAGVGYGIAPNHEWLEPLVKTSDDVELLPYLLPEPALVRNNFDSVRRLQDRTGDAGLVAFRPMIGVDHLVVDALGVANAMIASIDNPLMLDRMVQIVDEWHMEIMKIVLEAGWKIIFDAWFNFSLSVGWSPEFYRTRVVPLLKKHADLIHSYGAKMFFYDDGKQAHSIGYVIESGADIIQTLTPPPGGDLDFNWLADNYGGKACLNGGIDTVKIRFGKPEEIESDVRGLMEILGPTGRFILGTSDSITEDTPEENMWALFKTAREYGKVMADKLYR